MGLLEWPLMTPMRTLLLSKLLCYITVRSLLTGNIHCTGSDESKRFSLPYWRVFLASKKDSWMLPQKMKFMAFQHWLVPSPWSEKKLLTFYQIQKGASSARSDDTKSLKSAIVDWLMPSGEALIPPIARNVKIDRGFNHDVTGALLCPAGVDWSDHG